MEQILLYIDEFINTLIASLGVYGPILGCLLILVESIVPVLPLSVFITLNFLSFGKILGFIVSYILTVCGCSLAFYISRRIFSKRFDYLIKRFNKNRALKFVKQFSNIKLNHLVLVMAFPFTPAFLINIFSGVSNMEYKKFLTAAMIAKPFMVYFWGYVGVTLIDSLTHPIYLLKVVVILLIAYILSNLINKKLDLD